MIPLERTLRFMTGVLVIAAICLWPLTLLSILYLGLDKSHDLLIVAGQVTLFLVALFVTTAVLWGDE